MGLVTSIDLKPEQKQLIKHYLSTFLPRTQVWAYGSRVKWAARPSSDLDVVIFSQPEQKRYVSKLKEMLEESNLPFNVDIFVWDQVPENFIPSIKTAYYVLQEKEDNTNDAAWPLVKLGDHIESCLGKMLDKNKNKGEYSPYLGNSNVRWGYFDLDNLSDMKFEAHEHERYGIKKGDLIVCEGGEPGRCAIWDCDIPDMKIQKALHRIRPLEGLDSEYLFYWFLNSGKTGHLEPFFTGTTIKHLTGKALAQLPIKIPPLEYQKDGANILRSLDKKIELNTQTNQILEKMAQTLFKSWFVDFDPVFDNLLATVDFKLENLPSDFPEALLNRAEKRLLALDDNAKAALLSGDSSTVHQHFSNEFEHNEQLGWIPKGWEEVTFESLIDLIGGGTPKTTIEEYWNGSIPWFSVVDAPNDSDVFVIDTDKHVTQLGVDKSSTKILRLGTTIISARDTVGKCAFVGTPMAMNQSCYGIVGKEKTSDEFIYYLTKYQVSDLQKRGHDSVFNTITRETFKSINLPFSGSLLTNEFSQIVIPLFNKILMNNRQNIELTKLRDTLLPKLISGELQIPTASVDTSVRQQQ